MQLIWKIVILITVHSTVDHILYGRHSRPL